MRKSAIIAAATVVTAAAMTMNGQPTHADPVGPQPVPPPGSTFGPPGWAPAPKVGAPPVFANTHGTTDSRGTRAGTVADWDAPGPGLPGSVIGPPKAPGQNLGPAHGVGPYGGFEYGPPLTNGGGTKADTVVPPLEDPHGRPLRDIPMIPAPPTVKPPAAYG